MHFPLNLPFRCIARMQNSRFIRDILMEQSILSRGYTELLQKSFDIVQKGSNAKKENEKEGKSSYKETYFNIKDISVLFPPPASLNLTNITDQVSNIGQVADPILETLNVSDEDKTVLTPIIKKRLFRKYIPNIDWDDIDELVNASMKDLNKQKLKTPPSDETSDSDEVDVE